MWLLELARSLYVLASLRRVDISLTLTCFGVRFPSFLQVFHA